MINVILPMIIIVAVVIALVSSIRHFKGEGGCCGGASEVRVKRKKLDGKLIGKKQMKIDGMHCENCRNRVERALDRIDGVSARVNLRKKTAEISLDRPIDDAVLEDAVEKAGYHGEVIKE